MGNTEAPVPDAARAGEGQPLFRKQAVDFVGSRQYGTVILTQAFSHTFLTGMFVVMALAIVAFFMLFSTTRKAHTQGILLPTSGVIRIVSTQPGLVTSMRVREGQQVRKGDILFTLENERSSVLSGSAEKTISRLLHSKRDSLSQEIDLSGMQSRRRLDALLRLAKDLRGEIAENDKQIALQAKRIALVEEAFERFQKLHATQYISAAQVQDKQLDVLEQQQRLAELKRTKAANARSLANTIAEADELELKARRELGALARDASEIEQEIAENEARREIHVRAPQDGMVTAMTAEVGQFVHSNTGLAALLPAGAELEAEIYAPSRSAGFIKPGMPVLLRYQAYPHQKFGQYRATVREIAHTALRPEELSIPGAVLAPNASGEPLYRIRLKLERQYVLAYGNRMPLKSGMLLESSVILDHRRLYEWVLEPLFSISGRL